MLHNFNEKTWKQALEKDPKLKELAVKAGVENNVERAKELNGCFAWNCGHGVVKSEAEQDLAQYMFCIDDNDDGVKNSIQGRILAARAAGISLNDL